MSPILCMRIERTIVACERIRARGLRLCHEVVGRRYHPNNLSMCLQTCGAAVMCALTKPRPRCLQQVTAAKTGRLWVYVRDDRTSADTTPSAVWFAYTPDQKSMHPDASPWLTQRYAASRRVRSLPGHLRNRACHGGCLLGTCVTTVP
jgi:hypothetical protein